MCDNMDGLCVFLNYLRVPFSEGGPSEPRPFNGYPLKRWYSEGPPFQFLLFIC